VTDRQKAILDLLERQGAAGYADLAARFQVSTMTIRRDVEELANQRAVVKTIGGAQKADAPAYLYETALHARLGVHASEKRTIAETALQAIGSRRTIFLDGSTTCLELGRLLAKRPDGLTILTNSSLLCNEVGRNREHTVICLGGEYDADSLSFVGPSAEDAARKYFVDLLVVSTKGFIPNEGTFESAVANFRIKQIIARQAKEVMLLVDHSKFGERALSKVLDISQIHIVVTDRQTPRSALTALRRRGVKVMVAEAIRKEPATHAA